MTQKDLNPLAEKFLTFRTKQKECLSISRSEARSGLVDFVKFIYNEKGKDELVDLINSIT